MRLAFLSTSSLDYPSPLGRWLPLAKEMTRLGHTVHLITLHHDYRPEMGAVEQRDGVLVHYVGQMHVRGWGDGRRQLAGLALLQVAATAALALWRQARRVEVDAYHICKPQPMNGLAGLFAARQAGRPCYLDCDDYEAEANRFSGGWQKAVVRWFEDALPRRMAGVSVNTPFLAGRAVQLGVAPERVVYVPNGVERARFASLDREVGHRLRERYGLAGRPTILYVGSLSLAGHPLALLLDAFALLRGQVADARLVLVGGGEDRPFLERRVQELQLQSCVTMVGSVRPEEVPNYILMGDLSVDPVGDDAVARARSPLKVLESLACGVPVVTGDVGSRREILRNGEAGVLVRPGDARSLAEGIASLLADPTWRREMAAAGRDQAEHYMWDRLVHRFLAVYRGQLDAGTSAETL